MTDLTPKLVDDIVSRYMDPLRGDMERTFMLLSCPPDRAKAVVDTVDTALNVALLSMLTAAGMLEEEHGGGAVASAIDLTAQMLEMILPDLRAVNQANADENLGPTASMWVRPS